MENPETQQEETPARKLQDVSHDYLAERCMVHEQLVSDLLQILVQFHPYLTPALNGSVEGFNRRMAMLDQKYPVGRIMVPGLIKPH